MEKVILMTTREVNNLIEKSRNSEYEIKEVQYPQNLTRQFVSKNLLSKLFSDEIGRDKNLENESPLKKLYFIDSNRNDRNITRYVSLSRELEIKEEDKSVFIDFIADRIADKHCEYRKNRINEHNSHKHFGKLSYLKRDESYIFFANEYPVAICADTEAKRKYIDALFAEIEKIVGEDKLKNVDEFVVISHDKDWFNENRIARYYSNQQLKEEIGDSVNNYNFLKKQLENSKFHLLVFGHEMDSNVYKYVNVFGNEIINEMLNNSIIDFCESKAIGD
jgi:hypothetical protein